MRVSTMVSILFFALTPAIAAGQSGFYTVDPRATYLRTNADNPADPTIIFLEAMAGHAITLTPSGIYAVAGGGPTQPGHFWAVFSATNVLLPDQGVLDRVQDAIDIGLPLDQTALTEPTFIGNIPMDIPEDFFIPDAGLTVAVPTNASYLFVGIPDSYFADNSSPDPASLGLTVTTTPEPATITLLAFGLAGIGFWRRRQKLVRAA